MIILVNATSLHGRGSLTVIQEFLLEMNSAKKYLIKNNISLKVLVTNKGLSAFENECVEVLYVGKPFESVLSKWQFEKYTLTEYVKKFEVNVYLSLQNYGIKSLNIPQFVFLHQAIPFSNLLINELELKLFIKYKIIFNYLLKKNINKIEGFFVQTHWMKCAIQKKYKYKGHIKVIKPSHSFEFMNEKEINNDIKLKLRDSRYKILYVTSDNLYKNNKRLVEAIKLYNRNNSQKVDLFLTLNGSSEDHVNYIGQIPHNEIGFLYSEVDALIFPSLCESLGLPLLEAKSKNLDLIVPDLPYAKEICKENAIYFEPRNILSIATAIKTHQERKRNIKKENEIKELYDGRNYISFIKYIMESQKEEVY